MYIPKSMKNKIANTFYDKTICVLESQTQVDAEGGVISNGMSTTEEFKGNVSFSNFQKIQEDYGLDYNIDIAITTNFKLEINAFIQYENIIYSVTDVIPNDSHYLVVATKWQI